MIRVLTGATLIDGTGAAPVPDAAVVIDGDRVTAAGARGALSWPNDAEVIDVRGRTIIPGLIDAHDHMAAHGYGLATRFGLDEPASTAHMRTARVLEDTLAMGYTTVRDGGGLDAGFKVAIEGGLIPGPRLVLGIQIVSPTGGIGDRVSPSGHTCCAVYDPLLPNSVANGPDGVRDVVRTMVRAGADVIKTATTGGASSRPGHGPLDAAFSLEEMQALVTESHALGRRVMCHALGGPGLDVALVAGVDSIEHGCYLDENPEHLKRMAGQGTFFVPTLLVYVYHRQSASPHVRARAHDLQKHHIASIQRALELGVPMAAGTDAGGQRPPEETRASSSAWSTPGSRPCKRCARARSGPRNASRSSARSARSRRTGSPTWSSCTATRSTTSRCCRSRAHRAGAQGRYRCRGPAREGAMTRRGLRARTSAAAPPPGLLPRCYQTIPNHAAARRTSSVPSVEIFEPYIVVDLGGDAFVITLNQRGLRFESLTGLSEAAVLPNDRKGGDHRPIVSPEQAAALTHAAWDTTLAGLSSMSSSPRTRKQRVVRSLSQIMFTAEPEMSIKSNGILPIV